MIAPLQAALLLCPLCAGAPPDVSFRLQPAINASLLPSLQESGESAEAVLQESLAGAPPGSGLPEEAYTIYDPFPSGLPLEWLGPIADNLRFTIDLSGRFEWNSRRREWGITQFYGFDLYKVFSGKEGDWGILLLQGFATRINNVQPHPWFFNGSTDWEFVYRIFNFNYTGLAGGRFNVKVGHFEMPFGLEMLLDTNGTLRNVDTARNLGIKADWGVTLNGVIGHLEYEVGLGRGSGNEWRAAGSPYEFVGRIGTAREEPWVFGLSGFYGDLYRPNVPGNTIQRRRIGLDASWFGGPVDVMSQMSFGLDNDDTVINSLVELGWKPFSEGLMVYLQLRQDSRQFEQDWSTQVQTRLGFEWAPDRHWVLSAEWVQNLVNFEDQPADATIRLQARYRF
ncbi:MAG: hypothetical protein P8M22_06900 [Phycisphaerales bacterium]|nr:hypothetical protein [Phycisphaerales bacterium]